MIGVEAAHVNLDKPLNCIKCTFIFSPLLPMTCVLKIDILRGNPFRSLIFSTDVYWNLKLAVSIANMTEATYGHTLVATGADIADMKAVVLGTGSHCEVKHILLKYVWII